MFSSFYIYLVNLYLLILILYVLSLVLFTFSQLKYINSHLLCIRSRLKDTRREEAPPNNTPALTESSDMGIWVVDTSNQLYTRES